MPVRPFPLLALAAVVATGAMSALGAPPQAAPVPRPSHSPSAPKPPSKRVIALFDAAERGDTAKVRALLDAGVPVKSRYPNGLTPLILASMMNHPDTAKLLLDRGADVNAALMPGGYIGGSTALIMAAGESMNILAGAKTPPSPPGYDGHEIEFMKKYPDQMRQWERQTDAWAKGYGLIVRMLLDHGADVNAQTAAGKIRAKIMRKSRRVRSSGSWATTSWNTASYPCQSWPGSENVVGLGYGVCMITGSAWTTRWP